MSNSADPNPVDLLAKEFLKRYQDGERPHLTDYIRRFPEFAEEIQERFPAILAQEHHKQTDSDGPAKKSPQPTPTLGQLGDYRIIREVGRGGMGVVYEAEQVSLGRRVALKVLPQQMLENPRHRLRFEREAKAAAKLHHTNIVPVFGVGESDGQLYYVMQFIQGLALNDVLTEIKVLRERTGSPSAPSKEMESPHASRDVSAADVARSLMAGALPRLADEASPVPVADCLVDATVTFPQESPGSVTVTPLTPALNEHVQSARQQSTQQSDSTVGSNSSVVLPGTTSSADKSAHRQSTYWESIARIGQQVASALEYAHGQGVLHRDIKPANLVLDLKGTVWVTDFGLAKVDDDHGLTQTGDVLGTLRYMAPETFKGMADARSEVYSLGLTLYEMLAFRPAFNQTNRIALIDRVMSAQVEPLGKVNPEVPVDLQTIIHKSIDSDPAHRYQSAGKLAEELQRYIDDVPIEARRISHFERLSRWSRHNKGLAASLLTSGLLVTLIAVTSTIAAGYFRSLSNELNNTVAKLTSATAELTAAGHAAENAKQVAENKSEEAVAAQRKSQTILADMQVERGLLSGAQGDPATAMLWFTQAASQTPHDQKRQAANHLRTRNWMYDAILPVALLKFTVPGDPMHLAFQPYGELLLSWKPGSLQIWNLHLEQSLVWTRELDAATAVCWAPNGRQIAVGFPSGELELRDIPSGTVAKRLQHPDRIEAIAFSRDGARLALSGRTVHVWNIEAEPTLDHTFIHPQPVHSLLFSRDKARLVTACRDQFARVFAIDDAQQNSAPIFPELPHAPGVEGPPVFVNGDRQLITFNAKQGKLGWWNMTDGQDATPPSADMNTTYIRRLSVSQDGQWFAATGGYLSILWNVDGTRTTKTHPNDTTSSVFNPDGTMLLTGCEDWKARLWSVTDPERPAISVPQMEGVRLCAISDDGNLAAVCGWTGLRVWRLPDQNLIVGHAEKWQQRFWIPRPGFDGKWVTRGAWHEIPFLPPTLNSMTVVEGHTGRAVGPTIQIPDIVDSCLCGDHRSVAIISITGEAGTLAVFDAESGKPVFAPIRLPGVPQSVAARPGSSHVAVMCKSGQTLIVDHRTGTVIRTMDNVSWSEGGHTARVTYSPDGSHLIELNPRHEVSVRDSETGELRYPLIRPLMNRDGLCRTLAVSSDSRWLATGVNGQNAVQVWDLATGEAASERLPHPGDSYGIFAVAFSPDGQWILSGNKDGRARLWDWRKGTLAGPPLQHPDEVLSVAFTTDGRYAVTGVRNGTARIWGLPTGKLIAPPVRYPLPKNTSTETVTVLGNRVILGAVGYPILDLGPLLTDPKQPVGALQTLAELATGGHVELGELSGLADNEWGNRWDTFREREFTSEAVAAVLARELDKVHDSASRAAIADRAARQEPVLVELDRLRPNVPQIKVALAAKCERHGDFRGALQYRKDAITLFEKLYAERPNEDGLASQLTGLLTQASTLSWQELNLRQIHSRDGAILARRSDGSILASGNHGLGDIYTLTANAPGVPITAIRLEVLPDASLPLNGPGRHESGNFQLASFRVFRTGKMTGEGKVAGADVKSVPLADAWASYTYPAPRIHVLGTIRPDRQQVWHVFGRPGQSHHAIYALEQPLTLDRDELLVIELKHHEIEPAINIGCFRLSINSDKLALKREQRQFAYRNMSVPANLSLALAYLNAGQAEKALNVLTHSTETKSTVENGLRLLLLTQIHQERNQLQAARQTYDLLIEWLQDNTMPDLLQNQVTEVMQSTGGLTLQKAVSQQQKWEAETEIHQITQQIQAKPEVPLNYERRAELFARLGNWRRCADDYNQLRTVTPNEGTAWTRAAASLLMADDLKGYATLCQEMLKQFRDTQEHWIADVVCKSCLLRPDIVPLNDLPTETLKSGLSPTTSAELARRYTVDYALVQLRQGNSKQALDLVTVLPNEPGNPVDSMAQVIRAMAEHQLGNSESARTTLAAATETIHSELRTLGSPNYAGPLPVDKAKVAIDWLIIELLRREANALILKETPGTSQ